MKLWDRLLYRSLIREVRSEGRRLADEVRAGRMTRAQLEEAAQATGDGEPIEALRMLDREGF